MSGDDIDSKDFWRLGHRRPWWQWNVITLFVGLFALVWIRELFRLPQTATWMICVVLAATWFLGPLLLLPKDPKVDPYLSPETVVAESDGFRFGYLMAAIGMFACVVMVGGFLAGAFSVLAAMLYAAAVRREQS